MCESEERFRALVIASSDVVYRMSADWTGSSRIPANRFDTSLGSQHRCKGKAPEEWCFHRPPLLRTPAKINP
jgi:hypothetical protein